MAQDDSLEGEGGGEPVCPAGLGIDARGIDWAAVWHDYVHGDMSLDRIAWKHRTTDATLRKRAKAGGWVRLVGTTPLPRGRRAGPRGAEPPSAEEKRRARMVKRLFAVLDAKITALEARMNQGDDGVQSAADAERDARSLTALARLYAKLVEMDEAGLAGSQDQMKDGDDADRLRRDLADRLGRLERSGDA
jgi:hypothetical protein